MLNKILTFIQYKTSWLAILGLLAAAALLMFLMNGTDLPFSNPAVIAVAGEGYFALAGGTTTLTATGNPSCLNLTPPWGMPSTQFMVTVIVP